MEMSCELSHVDTAGNARIVEDAASDWNGYELFNQSSPPTKSLGKEDKITCDPTLAELGGETVKLPAMHVKQRSPKRRSDANRPPDKLDMVGQNHNRKTISDFVVTFRQKLNCSEWFAVS
jgi:hypothetical protein